MKTLLILLVFMAVTFSTQTFAEEAKPAEPLQETSYAEAPTEEAYEFPNIAPEFKLFGGYSFTNLKGSAGVEEYEYLHDSPVFGGEARIFSFPHRFHFDFSFNNEKDYFGDLNYSYKDLFVLRGLNRTLFHNLDTITLYDLNPATATPSVSVRDSGETYGAKVGITNLFMRIKTPDFPFHLYADGNIAVKDGTAQQRSMLGAGYFNNNVRASQKRDIDWETKNITIGANSHLGPVEIDFSHGERRVDVNGDRVLYDAYTAAMTGPTTVLKAGTYPHNLVPELKGSSNTLKLHTSHTGSLVASATFANIERENRETHGKIETFIGQGEVTWMPAPPLTVFLKYRHKDLDTDAPDTVPYGMCNPSNNPANNYACTIKPLISSTTDTVTGIVRYRPLKGITLRGEYTYEDVRRDDAEEWFVPEETQRQKLELSADIRMLKGLTFNARYIHRSIDNPASNAEPERLDEIRFALSWVPVPWMNAFLDYRRAKERRDSIGFVYQETLKQTSEGQDITRDQFTGNLTFLIRDNLTLAASYAYFHLDQVEDIAYQDITGQYKQNSGVPMDQQADVFGIDLSYTPLKALVLSAGFSYTRAQGSFSPSAADLTLPVSVASFSKFKTEEIGVTLSGEYTFKGGFTAGIRYRYSDLNDTLNNPYDDVQDGQAHVIYATLTKRW